MTLNDKYALVHDVCERTAQIDMSLRLYKRTGKAEHLENIKKASAAIETLVLNIKTVG